MSDDDLLSPTPEGDLIRRARERTIPKISIRAASARIGISPEHWGNIERGYKSVSSAEPPRRLQPASAALIAKMARVVGISPEQMESEGQRPDAAEAMRTRLAAPALLRQARDDDSVLGLAPRMAEAVEQPMADIAGLAESAAEIENVDVPSGTSVFGAGPEAARWDKLVQLGRDMLPGQGFSLAQLIRAAAVARVKDEERREGYGGNEAVARLIRS
jgi:hypothetical protein